MFCSRRRDTRRLVNMAPVDAPSLKRHGHIDHTLGCHSCQALAVMCDLRRDKQLCDVMVRVIHNGKEQVFAAHRLVLAASSPVFRAMFTSNLQEHQASEVKLEGIEPRVMECLIEFAYTSLVSVDEQCVQQLMLASSMYQVEGVINACSDFLVKNMDSSNVIGICHFAEQIGCTKLHLKAKEYINIHFTEVIKEEEFFNLTHCQLLDLVSQDQLNVLCETEVYKACMEWVRWDLEGRAQYFHALLNALQIYALPLRFLKHQLQVCPILDKLNLCRDFLSKIFQEMNLRKQLPPVKQRGNKLIYVAGGYWHRSVPNMEAFSPRTGQWLKLADMPVPRSGTGTCVVLGLFYTIGGRNNSQGENVDMNTLDCYNPLTNKWTQRAPMSVPRNRVGVGVIDGVIYAVGGSYGSLHHQSAEKYDPETNEWKDIAPMGTRRIGAGVAVWNGLLYVVGGFDGNNRLDSVECYCPERDEWSSVTPMGSVRSGAGVVTLGNYIYVAGGYDGREQISSVERYCIEDDRWECVASMKHSRSAMGITAFQGKIYTLGGFNQEGFLNSVECYDPEKNEWTEVTTMPTGRSGVGVAVTMEPCPRNLTPTQTKEAVAPALIPG
ncbi:kelch-like ECH-associated protein 1A [Pristis pectinata]|uniref:kelch-like ECH-associated protein 1A n=1 Tax=Pristis pectinata TaxID=685728 RepID=UPI00223E873D|nr:kelch-like ECH-associated protein 1A [Pristis pectinata]XP_051893730.1 kelch-like ECH-associated protein 1A [Pristis pectinata]